MTTITEIRNLLGHGLSTESEAGDVVWMTTLLSQPDIVRTLGPTSFFHTGEGGSPRNTAVDQYSIEVGISRNEVILYPARSAVKQMDQNNAIWIAIGALEWVIHQCETDDTLSCGMPKEAADEHMAEKREALAILRAMVH